MSIFRGLLSVTCLWLFASLPCAAINEGWTKDDGDILVADASDEGRRTVLVGEREDPGSKESSIAKVFYPIDRDSNARGTHQADFVFDLKVVKKNGDSIDDPETFFNVKAGGQFFVFLAEPMEGYNRDRRFTGFYEEALGDDWYRFKSDWDQRPYVTGGTGWNGSIRVENYNEDDDGNPIYYQVTFPESGKMVEKNSMDRRLEFLKE